MADSHNDRSDRLTRILAGHVDQDMTFNEKVWALTSRVPPGRVTTYAAIARALHSQAYRAVGGALNRNPHAPRVPCHRVVGSTGSLTGYAHGLDAKSSLLQKEGVPVAGHRVKLVPDVLYTFED